MELVHKLLQPNLGSDGDDDGLFEMGILEKKVPEKDQLYASSRAYDLKGTMTTWMRVAMKLLDIGLHGFLSFTV